MVAGFWTKFLFMVKTTIQFWYIQSKRNLQKWQPTPSLPKCFEETVSRYSKTYKLFRISLFHIGYLNCQWAEDSRRLLQFSWSHKDEYKVPNDSLLCRGNYTVSLPTMVDKSSWDTLPKKHLFRCQRFSISNFHIAAPSPLFNIVTTWQCPRNVFQHCKGGEAGFGYRQKDVFFSYGRTPIESVCFA